MFTSGCEKTALEWKKIQTTTTVKKEPSFFHLAVEATLSCGLAAAVLKAPGDGSAPSHAVTPPSK